MPTVPASVSPGLRSLNILLCGREPSSDEPERGHLHQIGVLITAVGVLIAAVALAVNWHYTPSHADITVPSPAPLAAPEPSPVPNPITQPSSPQNGGPVEPPTLVPDRPAPPLVETTSRDGNPEREPTGTAAPESLQERVDNHFLSSNEGWILRRARIESPIPQCLPNPPLTHDQQHPPRGLAPPRRSGYTSTASTSYPPECGQPGPVVRPAPVLPSSAACGAASYRTRSASHSSDHTASERRCAGALPS